VLSTSQRWEGSGEIAGGDRHGPLRLPGTVVGLALVWAWWFEVGRETLGATLGDAATPRAVLVAALAGLIGRVVAQIVEAGFYVAAWRALGRPLAFLPMFVAIVSLSLFDVTTLSLVHWAGDAPPAWLAPLVGIQALPGVLGGEPGLRIAFGGFGLTCLARLAGTAHAQKSTGAAWRWRAALTLGAWLAGRLATWWTTDLVRGVSPLP